MRLEILNPAVARIPCDQCRVFVFDLKTGEQQDYPKGSGQWLKRGKGGPPCEYGDDMCPKGKPGRSDFTAQNRRIWEHYQECAATGIFPDDDLVKEHAVILRKITRQIEEKRLAERMAVELANVLIRAKVIK